FPAAAAGLVIIDAPTELAVSERSQPGDNGHIIAPGGSLQIDAHGAVATLPADLIGEQRQDEAATNAPEYLPADGEVFRVVDLTYDQDGEHGDIALALNTG